MKKIFVLLLSLIMLMSIIFTSGCKNDVFNGNYKVVAKDKVLKVIDYFIANEENLIDWASGLEVSIYQKSNTSEINVKCKMASSILDSSNGVGEWNIELKNGSRTEKTKLIYDGLFLYKEIEFAGNKQKTKGRVNFDDVINFTDIEDFDDAIGEALYLALEEKNVVFYLDESNKDLTKLKIEEYVDEEGFGVAKYLCWFVFDSDYNLEAVKIEMQIETETENTELTMDIKRWNGTLSAPNNVDQYGEVENILQ